MTFEKLISFADIIVEKSVELTIEPGVTIKFMKGESENGIGKFFEKYPAQRKNRDIDGGCYRRKTFPAKRSAVRFLGGRRENGA